MHGVVVRDGHTELVDDLQVRRPEAGEVTVRVLASGLCRSDLLPIDEPSGAPMVLGHEAAGVIEAVGSAVDGLEIGQMVAVTCPVPCNNCDACSRGLYTACASSFGFGEAPFSRDGLPILALARVSSLAEFITVDQFQVHPVASLSAPAAALVGCAVSTGYGMTRNVVELKTGETIMVFGVGGIGINSIQTARLIGARRIIAVDINEEKEAVARKFGADEFIAIKPGMASESIVAEVRHVAPEQVDAVVDCTGQASVLEAAQLLLKAGGRLGLVGIPHAGGTMKLDINNAMYRHITVRGALNGACNPFTDVPDIVQLAEQGRLDLESQVSHVFPLSEYQEAVDALRQGRVLRAVIEMPSGTKYKKINRDTPENADQYHGSENPFRN